MFTPDICYSDLCLLGKAPQQTAGELMLHGANHIELMMDGPAWDNFTENKPQLLAALRQNNCLYSLHAPCWDVNLTSENSEIRSASLATTLRAIDFAASLSCTHLVIHPGFCHLPSFQPEVAKARSYEILRKLCAYAKENNVTLAVENVGNNGTSLYSYHEFIHLLDGFGSEVGYLVDIGHALLNGWNSKALLEATLPRLLALHLHGNNQKQDQHLPIENTPFWQNIIKQALHAPHKVSFILEYSLGTPLQELQKGKDFILQQAALC